MSQAGELSLPELEDEITAFASHLYAGMSHWLELVGELDRRGDWTDCGAGSCAEWLAWRCALLPRAAREHVRVARKLPDLHLIRAAFARGELSYSKVRALTRVADADREEELLELARALTAAQLDRAVRAFQRVTTADANNLHDRAYVSTFWDDDGCLVVRARLAPEDGGVFLRALEAAYDSLWERAGDDRPQWEKRARWEEYGPAEPRPTRAEALVEVADRALSPSKVRSGGDRYQLVVHVDADALTADADGAGPSLEDGPAIAPETARRLACDCSVVAISGGGRGALDFGRKTRTIPPSLRRALRVRDRGCRFPGCENRRFVDGHHLRHWALGGETNLDNVLLLCRRHHRLVHEGGYAVDEQMRFYDRWGQRLRPVAQLPPGDHSQLPQDHAIGADTCAGGEGEDVELEDIVDALIAVTGTEAAGLEPASGPEPAYAVAARCLTDSAMPP